MEGKMKKELMIIAILSLLLIGCSEYSSEDKPKTKTINVSGYGDDIRFVELKRGLAIVSVGHSGSGYFGVWLKDMNGNDLDLLANDVGSYFGTTSTQIDYTGTYLLDVSADKYGVWAIIIEQ